MRTGGIIKLETLSVNSWRDWVIRFLIGFNWTWIFEPEMQIVIILAQALSMLVVCQCRMKFLLTGSLMSSDLFVRLLGRKIHNDKLFRPFFFPIHSQNSSLLHPLSFDIFPSRSFDDAIIWLVTFLFFLFSLPAKLGLLVPVQN